MAEKGKCSFGYLKKTAVRQGLFALIMVAFCAGIFLFGFFVFPQYSVILTVISVLGMLPAAKCIVSMILFMRAEKHSCSDTLHQTIKKKCFWDLIFISQATMRISLCVSHLFKKIVVSPIHHGRSAIVTKQRLILKSI